MNVWIAPALTATLAVASGFTPFAGREARNDRAARAEAVGAVGTDVAGPGGVLVMPFENIKREGRIFWLGEAAAVLLTDDLAELDLACSRFRPRHGSGRSIDCRCHRPRR